MNFENKVVIVTGAGTGIGKEIALLFSSLGAKLAIAGRRRNKLSQVKKLIENNKRECLHILADISKVRESSKVIKNTKANKKYEKKGVLDVSGWSDHMEQKSITEMPCIEYPIIQGADGGFGTSDLAGPVSEAGGLGIITASALRTPERLREDIAMAKSMTDKPIGVNLSPGMLPNIDEMVEATIESGIKVVETAGGSSDVYGKRLKEAGVVWIHKVATVKHAVSAEKQGADAVVIVGIEGAGGKSPIQVTTLINIPLAAKVIKIPIIAAGGIGDARSFMAALAMGAEAVYMGTVFMAVKECPISDRYKQSIVDRSPFDPVFRARVFSPPGAEMAEMMRQGASAPIPDRDEDGTRISGVSLAVAAVDRVVTAKELIQDIISGAEVIRQRWALS